MEGDTLAVGNARLVFRWVQRKGHTSDAINDHDDKLHDEAHYKINLPLASDSVELGKGVGRRVSEVAGLRRDIRGEGRQDAVEDSNGEERKGTRNCDQKLDVLVRLVSKPYSKFENALFGGERKCCRLLTRKVRE